MTLTDDELRHAISAGMTAILEGVTRVRHRRAEAAIRRGSIAIRASRAERRREARERIHRPARQQPLLTPYSVRMQMIEAGDVRLTELDSMISDEEARALEEWVACEEVLAGSMASVDYLGDRARGSGRGMPPVADDWMGRLGEHSRRRCEMGGWSLRVLAVFTALQNGSEGALSAAQYGERFFPRARNKRRAFIAAVADVARKLV
jgi:hypothetical protein